MVTVKGVVVPCTSVKDVIRPTVKGGYRVLRLANKKEKK